MKKILFLLAAVLAGTLSVQAQKDSTATAVEAGFFDSSDLTDINYANFVLPPLGVLFENAKSNPTIELAEKERQIQHALMNKEKKFILTFLHAHGSYSYGNTSTTATITDVTTPLYSQYNKSNGHYWNVGGAVNIPIESLFDLSDRVHRAKLAEDRAVIQKEQAYETLKQQIASLYVDITNKLVSLKTSAENAAAYKGSGLLTEQEFKTGNTNVQAYAYEKQRESGAIQEYQNLQSQITTNILILEIITHTPIITNTLNAAKISKSKK